MAEETAEAAKTPIPADAGGAASESPSAVVVSETPIAAPPAEPAAAAAAPTPDWRDRRIAKLTAQLREEQEKNARVVPPPAPEASPAPLDPTLDFDRRVKEAAAQQVAAQTFSQKCGTVRQIGEKKFSDFGEKLQLLQKVVNPADSNEAQSYYRFLEAGIEAQEEFERPELLAEVIHELGSDLNEASRVLALTPTKMAMEFAKRAARKPEPEAVSTLPKPITPVGGGHGGVNPIDPTDPRMAGKLSTSEWMKRREAQVAEGRRR